MTNERNKIVPQSTVDILIDRLTQMIIDGTFKKGDKLPTESELAESFGVSRNTVREALRTLVAYGILVTRRPNGTFVSSGSNPAALNPFLYGMLLNSGDSHRKLVEIREIYELGELQLLSQRELTEDQQNQLDSLAEQLKIAIQDRPEDTEYIIEKDLAFHSGITAIFDNDMLEQINEMLAKLSYASRKKTIREMIDGGQSDELIQVHLNIIKAIRSRDVKTCYEAIDNSFRLWRKAIK